MRALGKAWRFGGQQRAALLVAASLAFQLVACGRTELVAGRLAVQGLGGNAGSISGSGGFTAHGGSGMAGGSERAGAGGVGGLGCAEDRCGGECVDLATDPQHCGECGYACTASEVCSAGSCRCQGAPRLLSVTPANAALHVALDQPVSVELSCAPEGDISQHVRLYGAQSAAIPAAFLSGQRNQLLIEPQRGSALRLTPFFAGELITVVIDAALGGPYVGQFRARTAERQPNFVFHQSLKQAQIAALADLDADGDIDALTGNGTDTQVWFNDGAGVFSAGPVIAMGQGGQFVDFNQDGHLDIVSGTVLLGDGQANFSSTGILSHGSAAGDLDGDGDVDLFDSRFVRFNDGSGNIELSVPLQATSGPHDVDLGDLDNDGDLDAVLTADYSVTVFTNDGSGAFSMLAAHEHARALDLDLGDLDADGDLDLLVGEWGANGARNRTWLNDGVASFVAGDGPGLRSIIVELADVDGDGDLDATLGDDHELLGGYPARVMLNDGRGKWSDSGQRIGGEHVNNVFMADLDGDSDLDAVVTMRSWFEDPMAEVWLNQD
jgi:hypothetical protein